MKFVKNQTIFHQNVLLSLKYLHLLPEKQTIFSVVWCFWSQFGTIQNNLDAEVELKCFTLDIMLHLATAVACLWKAAVQDSMSTSPPWYKAKLHPHSVVWIFSLLQKHSPALVTVRAPRDLLFCTREGLAGRDKNELKPQRGT